MNQIEVRTLLGSSPLGFLAAVGLLRVLRSVGESAKLSFVLKDDWIAVLHCDRVKTLEGLVERCATFMTDRDDSDLTWAADVRVEPAEFRKHLQRFIEQGVEESPFYAMAAEGVVDKAKSLIKPGPMYMVSGQQSFLGNLRELYSRVRKNSEAAFREAVIGPWQYKTAVHHMGWDPAGERLHALRAKAPTKEKAVCIAGATWLAFEALAAMPAFENNGRALCSGFIYRDRSFWFRWGLPTNPASWTELKTLLRSAQFWRSDGTLRGGLGAVYESKRSEFGQGYAIFRPAQPVAPVKKVSAIY